MPKLRRLTGRELIAILENFGFSVSSIRGSHHKLRRFVDGQPQTLNIPVHGSKTVPAGTLRAIYREASRYIDPEILKPYFYAD